MDIKIDGPRVRDRSLTDKLKAKSRRRREGLGRSRVPAGTPRNDPLPNLDLVYVPVDDLRMPSRRFASSTRPTCAR